MNVPLRRYWRLLATYLRPQWPRAALLALLLLAGIALDLAGPQLLRRFIDTAQSGGALQRLSAAALLFLGVALAGQAVGVAETYLAEAVGWTATNALRADLALHCLKIDLGFHSRRTPGELIERVDGDVSALANFFSRFVIHVAGNALLLGVLLLLVRLDWRIGLAAALFAAATSLAMLRMYQRALPLWTALRQTSASFFGALGETLAAAEDLRALGAVPFASRRIAERLRAWLPLLLRAVFAEQAVWMVSLTLFALANAAALLLGTALLRRGALSIGTIYLIFQYVDLLSRPIGEIQGQVQDFQQAGAGIGRIEELLGTRSALPDGGSVGLPGGPLALDLEHVSFAYPRADSASDAGATPQDAGAAATFALRDISLHLAPGRVLGLLGRTGSGKSTLAALLLRFADPDSGAVRLGGRGALWALRDAPLAELRRRAGMVTQEVQLFAGSVRDNLTFFRRTIPDARLLAAIAALGLSDWLAALPAGLDSALAPGGLSAGEAQLLALVRLFLRDPGLVVLDEASSRLDPLAQARCEAALARLLRGRTAVIIAHRLSAVARADDIAILEGGRIVEQGPRAALAADAGSRYAALLRAETRGQADAGDGDPPPAVAAPADHTAGRAGRPAYQATTPREELA